MSIYQLSFWHPILVVEYIVYNNIALFWSKGNPTIPAKEAPVSLH